MCLRTSSLSPRCTCHLLQAVLQCVEGEGNQWTLGLHHVGKQTVARWSTCVFCFWLEKLWRFSIFYTCSIIEVWVASKHVHTCLLAFQAAPTFWSLHMPWYESPFWNLLLILLLRSLLRKGDVVACFNEKLMTEPLPPWPLTNSSV